jgi:hypothetical protein
MGDEKNPVLKRDGAHAGDFVIRPVPSFGTDGHLDTPASRERTRQREDDTRAAQLGGVTAPAHPLADPLHPAAAVLPLGQGGDVDASIEAARSALEGDSPDDVPIPIILHDPLTGKPIGTA